MAAVPSPGQARPLQRQRHRAEHHGLGSVLCLQVCDSAWPQSTAPTRSPSALEPLGDLVGWLQSRAQSGVIRATSHFSYSFCSCPTGRLCLPWLGVPAESLAPHGSHGGHGGLCSDVPQLSAASIRADTFSLYVLLIQSVSVWCVMCTCLCVVCACRVCILTLQGMSSSLFRRRAWRPKAVQLQNWGLKLGLLILKPLTCAQQRQGRHDQLRAPSGELSAFFHKGLGGAVSGFMGHMVPVLRAPLGLDGSHGRCGIPVTLGSGQQARGRQPAGRARDCRPRGCWAVGGRVVRDGNERK